MKYSTWSWRIITVVFPFHTFIVLTVGRGEETQGARGEGDGQVKAGERSMVSQQISKVRYLYEHFLIFNIFPKGAPYPYLD